MVRVISVHHFLGQNIRTVEQPTACTVAHPDRLLLALTNNCIEVRDLGAEAELLFTFPSVDEVEQILHCKNGDYVATLEAKFNRQNRSTRFVRIYVQWDSVATLQQSKMTNCGASLTQTECGMVQPMRARIAGRVTPTTNQSELGNLEMIEVPVRQNPDIIACCQTTGHLAVAAGKMVTFYEFVVKIHDISRLKFIDFEEMGFVIELAFEPDEMALEENYMAVMNGEAVHVFELSELTDDGVTVEAPNLNFKHYSDEPFDYSKAVEEEKYDFGNEKITIDLPTIVKENSIVHKSSPFIFTDKDMVAKIRSESKVQLGIRNLLQLKLVPIVIENAQRQISEEFKSMLFKPLYINENLSRSTGQSKRNPLRSSYSPRLKGLTFMVATQQEGYLFYYSANSQKYDADNCIAIYPFTAPVYKIVMEDYFLHALTEIGLETYTLRYGHWLARKTENIDNVNVACPDWHDAICLVGLRPFLGVEEIFLSHNHLVLLANSDTSPTHSIGSSSSSNAAYWTLYNLELPTPKTIFNDISIVANVHRFTSSLTYCHLMGEAHVILRIALMLTDWTMSDDSVRLAKPILTNREDLVETYRISCALLADHYIMCSNVEDHRLAVPYYKMAQVAPCDVLKRVRKLQEQANIHMTKGLMFYLKSVLLDLKHGPEADRFFGSGSKQNFADTIINLLNSNEFDDLPNLVLKSRILREYPTDKLIEILTEKLMKSTRKDDEKFLALSILHIQKNETNDARSCLAHINQLSTILLEYNDLLFDITQNRNKTLTTFSELSVLLIGAYPELLAGILVQLVLSKKILSLNKLIKVFLEYLPSSIGNDSNTASQVLQKTLEQYFEKYMTDNGDLNQLMHEKGVNEAMKLLARSYLSQLQLLQLKDEIFMKEEKNSISFHKLEKELLGEESDDTDKDRHQEKPQSLSVYDQFQRHAFEEKRDTSKACYAFARYRYDYLDRMPPFLVEITARLQTVNVHAEHRPNPDADRVLRKLQALLCVPTLPRQVGAEVAAFCALNDDLRGVDALRSIVAAPTDACQSLLDVCPQALPQLAKDRFVRRDDWKFLIAALQRRILRLAHTDGMHRVCFFHRKLLRDVLTYCATTMNLDQLIGVLPQRIIADDGNRKIIKTDDDNDEISTDNDMLNEIQNYEQYVIICKETMHANQINKLITTTGQQLLCTLNL